MSEINGMTPADIAMMEHLDGHEHQEDDDQMFEGNVVLIDARALTDTSRSVIETMRSDLDAEVVILTHKSVNKKRMRRARASIAEVGLDEIGDFIEPGSKIAVIAAPAVKSSSDDGRITGVLPDDCESSLHLASTLNGDLSDLATFFGVCHSQEATEKSKPTAEDFTDGLDEDQIGNKSGYGIDFENGRMGEWSVDQKTGESFLSYPLALTSIKGVNEASSQAVIKQAAIWIVEREREMDLSGRLVDDRVVLGAITEQDAKLPGSRRIRMSEPISFVDIRKPDVVLKQLGLTGDMPVPDSQSAKNTFFQMIVGASQSYEYPTIDMYQAVGWIDTKSHGAAWINSDSSIIANEFWNPAEVTDICGYTPSHPKTGENINVKAPRMSDYTGMVKDLSAFFDSLNDSGRVSVGTYLAHQAAAVAGATPVALVPCYGPTSSGKSTAMAWANLTSSTQDPKSFMSVESTDNAMKASLESGSGAPMFIDDFRVVKDEKKSTAMASAIGTAIRVAYGSTGAGRKRMTSTQNSGVKSAQSRGEVDLYPLIVFTMEDPIATYAYISGSDLTRLFEIPFDRKPADDGGVAMSNAHTSGAFTGLSSIIIGRAFNSLGDRLGYDTTKRASTSLLRKMQDERVAGFRRSMEEAPHQEIRAENILAFMRFGAQQILDALDMDPSLQEKARKVFEDAERGLWIPQVDKIVRKISGGEMTLGAEVIDSMMAMEGESVRILREGESVGRESSHVSVRPDRDLTVVARVLTTRSADRARVLAINPVRLAGSRAIGMVDSATISRNLMTIKGAYRGTAKVEPGASASKCVLVPIENTGIPADSVLFKVFDDDDDDDDVKGENEF